MNNSRDSQKGGVLVIGLVLLLMMTLFALSSMQGSIMQERMASAQRDGFNALEVAESGILDAQARILDEVENDNLPGPGWFYDNNPPDINSDATWSDASLAAGNIVEGAAVDGLAPRYFVQDMGQYVPEQDVIDLDEGVLILRSARVVVMAEGPSGRSRRFIESHFVYKP